MKKLALLVAGLVLSTTSQAITLTDVGVVGTVDAGTQSADVSHVTDWGNHLLSMSATSIATLDANNPIDGFTEAYATSNVDYNGVLTVGTRIDGATPDISSFEYVMGKYDGQNAGYIMFNVSDYLGDVGGTTIPEFSYSVWGDNAAQYQLSNITGYGVNPDPGGEIPIPAAAWLFGSGLFGLGVIGRKRKATL